MTNDREESTPASGAVTFPEFGEASAKEHPLGVAIDRLVHRALDIEDCARFLPTAREQRKGELKKWNEELRSLSGAFDTREKFGESYGLVLMKLIDTVQKLHRFVSSQPNRVMSRSLFLGLFAAFDAYVGDLLRALFECKQELFNRIGSEVPFKDILSSKSLADVKLGVLNKFVEDFRRESYVEQFEKLQKLFEIELKKFDRWSLFVETSQRRNLVAHCDGIVSLQYIEMCRREGVEIDKDIKPGSVIQISDAYLGTSCRLIMEVGVKLGHTLWRKVLPENLKAADDHLRMLAYFALQSQEWEWAAVLGEFIIGQRKFSSDAHRRVAIINYAIGMRYKESAEAARKIMAREDWSACSAQYRLADAVLRDDEDQAATIMTEIGVESQFLDETAYQGWPLFREFRGSKKFLDTYAEIYGHEFITELQHNLVEAEGKASGTSSAVAQSGGQQE